MLPIRYNFKIRISKKKMDLGSLNNLAHLGECLIFLLKNRSTLFPRYLMLFHGVIQVPTADMLVSTTLLVVMSTIWIQVHSALCSIVIIFKLLTALYAS